MLVTRQPNRVAALSSTRRVRGLSSSLRRLLAPSGWQGAEHLAGSTPTTNAERSQQPAMMTMMTRCPSRHHARSREMFARAPEILDLCTDAGFYSRLNLDNLSYVVFAFLHRLVIHEDDGQLTYGGPCSLILTHNSWQAIHGRRSTHGRRPDQLQASKRFRQQDQGLADGLRGVPYNLVR